MQSLLLKKTLLLGRALSSLAEMHSEKYADVIHQGVCIAISQSDRNSYITNNLKEKRRYLLFRDYCLEDIKNLEKIFEAKSDDEYRNMYSSVRGKFDKVTDFCQHYRERLYTVLEYGSQSKRVEALKKLQLCDKHEDFYNRLHQLDYKGNSLLTYLLDIKPGRRNWEQHFSSTNREMSYKEHQEWVESGLDYCWKDLKVLLSLGVCPRVQNYQGNTVLMLAAGSGYVEPVQILLEHERYHLYEWAQNYHKDTALILAAYYNTDEAMQLILEKICHQPWLINHQNSEGYTALMRAAQLGFVPKCDALLKKGAKFLGYYNTLSEDAFDLAICSKKVELIQKFIDHGADYKKVNERGETCLMQAVRNYTCSRGAQDGRKETLQFVASLPDIDHAKQNKKGQTALDIAQELANSGPGIDETIEVLKSK